MDLTPTEHPPVWPLGLAVTHLSTHTCTLCDACSLGVTHGLYVVSMQSVCCTWALCIEHPVKVLQRLYVTACDEPTCMAT